MAFQYEKLEELVVGLYDRDAIRFSDFAWTLKSGRKSPLFVNQRPITSFQHNGRLSIAQQKNIRDLAVDAYSGAVDALDKPHEHLYGIPQALTPMAAMVAHVRGVSLLWGRVGNKDHYGIHAELEGDYARGESVVPLDDVITTAASKFQAANGLGRDDLRTAGFVVMFDREEGGAEAVRDGGYDLIAVTGLASSMSILRDAGRIGQQEFDWIAKYHDELRAQEQI